MSEEHRDQAMKAKADERAEGAVDDEDDDEVESPFDHPAFLPVILWGLSIWFGYDGWINQDPDTYTVSDYQALKPLYFNFSFGADVFVRWRKYLMLKLGYDYSNPAGIGGNGARPVQRR